MSIWNIASLFIPYTLGAFQLVYLCAKDFQRVHTHRTQKCSLLFAHTQNSAKIVCGPMNTLHTEHRNANIS